MARQAIVIGLGQFGMALARALTLEGVEVIAIDKHAGFVQEASLFAAAAVRIDATDEDALSAQAPAKRDIAICAIGDESREGSIIVTALLRQLGCKHVISRATDDVSERILRLVGAHEVLRPERSFGERLARRLVRADILEEFTLGKDLVVSEVRVRPAMVGRSLAELALPRRFGLTVLGVQTRLDGQTTVLLPEPNRPLAEADTLLVVGKAGAAHALHGEG
jgi:trk system potassium uptake protein TrkA